MGGGSRHTTVLSMVQLEEQISFEGAFGEGMMAFSHLREEDCAGGCG